MKIGTTRGNNSKLGNGMESQGVSRPILAPFT